MEECLFHTWAVIPTKEGTCEHGHRHTNAAPRVPVPAHTQASAHCFQLSCRTLFLRKTRCQGQWEPFAGEAVGCGAATGKHLRGDSLPEAERRGTGLGCGGHSRGQNLFPMEELNPRTPAETCDVEKML